MLIILKIVSYFENKFRFVFCPESLCRPGDVYRLSSSNPFDNNAVVKVLATEAGYVQYTFKLDLSALPWLNKPFKWSETPSSCDCRTFLIIYDKIGSE
jgi:hypothetical protein